VIFQVEVVRCIFLAAREIKLANHELRTVAPKTRRAAHISSSDLRDCSTRRKLNCSITPSRPSSGGKDLLICKSIRRRFTPQRTGKTAASLSTPKQECSNFVNGMTGNWHIRTPVSQAQPSPVKLDGVGRLPLAYDRLLATRSGRMRGLPSEPR